MPVARMPKKKGRTSRLTRMASRGRERAEVLAHDAGPLIERGRDAAEEIAREAAPIVERASRRKRSHRRRKGVMFLGLLMAAGAVIAYLLWRKRDEEYARLVPEPDMPDITPAGGPTPEPYEEPREPVQPAPEPVAPRESYAQSYGRNEQPAARALSDEPAVEADAESEAPTASFASAIPEPAAEVEEFEFLEPESSDAQTTAATEAETDEVETKEPAPEPLVSSFAPEPAHDEAPAEETPAVEEAPIAEPAFEATFEETVIETVVETVIEEEAVAEPARAEASEPESEPVERFQFTRADATIAETAAPEAELTSEADQVADLEEAVTGTEEPAALDEPAAESEPEPAPEAQPAVRSWSNWSSWNGTAGVTSADIRPEAASEPEPLEQAETAEPVAGLEAADLVRQVNELPEVEPEPVQEFEPAGEPARSEYESPAPPAAFEVPAEEPVRAEAELEAEVPEQPAAAEIPALPRVQAPLAPRFEQRTPLGQVAADARAMSEAVDEDPEDEEQASHLREAPVAQQAPRTRPGGGGPQRLPQPPASATPPFSSSGSRLPPVRSRPPLPR